MSLHQPILILIARYVSFDKDNGNINSFYLIAKASDDKKHEIWAENSVNFTLRGLEIVCFVAKEACISNNIDTR